MIYTCNAFGFSYQQRENNNNCFMSALNMWTKLISQNKALKKLLLFIAF